MSESAETPIVNDAITSDDAGFSGDAGTQSFEDASTNEATEASAEVAEAPEAAPEAEASEGEGVQAETTDELKEEIKDAIEEGATEAEVEDMIKEFTLKVNGKEKKVQVDLNNEEDLVRRLQMAEAGQSAMQKAKEMEKQWEAEIERLRERPWEVMEEVGLNPDELAEARIRQLVEEQQKPEEQRVREQLEKELQDAREQLKKEQEEKEQARFQQLADQEAQKLNDEIDQALDGHTTLPKSPKTVQRIADAMLWAMENGYDDVSVQDVIPSVEDEIRREMSEFMEQLPEEMMETYIGKKNLERMRKKRLATAKTNNISNVKPTTNEVTEKKKAEPKKRMKAKEYFKNLK